MKEEPRLRFLIVDDEQSIRRLCMTVGQGLNFVCAEAETAEAALVAVETAPPDILVTFDGQLAKTLVAGDVVTIRRASRPLRLVRTSMRTHFDMLREKLKWGGG